MLLYYSLGPESSDRLGREPQPEVEAARRELRDLVARELAKLPKHERDAVTACMGLSTESYRSLARRHGRSPQTVCNWRDAGLHKLRPKLEGHL
jgi:DNA-directed RNA polymerase specialized sigma24 family protein